MKVIVCDDNPEDRYYLHSLINRYFKENNCPIETSVYKNGESLIKDLGILKTEDLKIAFLDIYMPGINGINVAKKIRETDTDMAIILTTTSLDHALDGYSVQALQYLVKPVSYTDVEKVLNSCAKTFASSLRFIEVISDRLKVKILLKDILYIEIYDHTCYIHTMPQTEDIKTKGCKIIESSRLTLQEVERHLDKTNFLKTHRSFIVNLRYVKNVNENNFELTSGATIPIRRNNKLAVKQAYMDYLFTQTRDM
ncbi:MAG: LytTR family DNA-binding domain-containing protein [Treponema sp.]|jgi:DNA-binding LytR/AlgR family response regulator|nr:LytTR family DNA-binding domain-containing protein [Treponema sp.]